MYLDELLVIDSVNDKDLIEYIGQSLPFFEEQLARKWGSEKVDIKYEIGIWINEGKIVCKKPLYIWKHSSLLIDVNSEYTMLKEKGFVSREEEGIEGILAIPSSNRIVEVSSREKKFLDSFEETLALEEALQYIEREMCVDAPVNWIIELEAKGLLKFCDTSQPRYMQLQNEKFNLGNVPAHIIGDPKMMRIFISLTDFCVTDCIYCYLKEKRPIRMNWNELRRILDYVVQIVRYNKMQVLYLHWWGGEALYCIPLVQKGIEYLKLYLGETQLVNVTSTSFIFRDCEKVIEFLKKENFTVYISCDGTPEIQDKNRPISEVIKQHFVYASHKYIEKNVELLNETTILKRFRATLTGDDIDKYEDIERYFVRFMSPFEICLSSNEPGDVQKKFHDKLYTNVKNKKEMLLRNDVIDKVELDTIWFNTLSYPYDDIDFVYTRCGYGGGNLIFNCDGDIFSCDRGIGDQEFWVGNIYKDSVDEIQERCIKMSENWLLSNGCSDCRQKSYCNGLGCYYQGYYSKKGKQCVDDVLAREKIKLLWVCQKREVFKKMLTSSNVLNSSKHTRHLYHLV